MQVVLHVGPHKTGTTSIQRHLLGQVGSPEPSGEVWYPAPERLHPGHADLALRLQNDGPNPLSEIVATAQGAGVERLVLSSENFVGLVPDHLHRLTEGLQGHEVLLVTTQGPMLRRLASLWQESVKYGRTEEQARFLKTFPDIHPERLGSPYRPGFWGDVVDATQPTHVVVVYVDPEAAPSVLIRDLARAAGLSSPRSDDEAIHERANEGLGLVEVEMLRRMNQLLVSYATADEGDVHARLRRQAHRMFKSADWVRHCPHVPMVASDDARRLATRLVRDFRAELSTVASRCPVEVIGSPGVLQAGLDAVDGKGGRDTVRPGG